MAVVNWSLQAYTDTAANLNARATPILEGQLAIETDTITTTPKFKIGDGVSLYSALPYFYGGASSAQNLQNVLSIGSATGGLGYNITLTTGDVLYIGNDTRSIYTPALGTTGITLDNTNSSEYIILKDAGGVDFSGTTVTMAQLGYLNGVTSSIQTQLNNKQPLDVDLTSWAGVTRAAGFDTFATTPSSANLASLVTDETGSGALVFGTSPTFTTDITTPKINGVKGNILLTNEAQTSGAITNFTFTNSANTNQTSGSEISNFKVNGASKTWAAGAITTQRWNYFTANTAAFASASTITNSYGLYVEAATAGTNATITNNYAAGFNAPIYVGGGLGSNASIMVDNAKGYGALWTDATQALILRISSGDVVQFGDISAKNKGIGFLTNGSTRVSIGASGGMTFADANNITFNATTGTKIGTATTEKLSFWNATPIVQPTTGVAAATFVANAGTAVNDASTFDGYTLKQVVKALRNIGLLG